MDNDEANDAFSSSVGFLYKTMLERDPLKRRVKPVQPHLLQLDFTGLENSSDDSDFKVGDESDDEDGDDDDDEDEDEDAAADGPADDNESVSSSSDSSVDRKSTDAKPVQPEVSVSKPAPCETNVPIGSSSSMRKKFRVSVCCVCLGDSSAEVNEIVECDSCGASVHEGCYGITEVESVGSSASSASTEPWFCDSCKAGIKPRCELCPNSGGIFKETDASKWVHLVCALYIPGVAFADVDRLTTVTLFEMSYSKWGSKDCCLCDDERFARTGVCIGCDAGLCRSYFHVTCAQREGLLTEASPDEEIADPFFAYCRQHADKSLVRVKRRNWLAVQSNMKNFESRLSEKEKLRVEKKLTVHQQTFAAEKEKQLSSAWVPTVKMPRMLQTSAYAVSQLLRKAELLGLAHPRAEPGNELRKKSHFLPMLSSDFAVYYNDRNSRIDQTKKRISELKIQREKLQSQETQFHLEYELRTKEIDVLESVGIKLQSQGELLWNILSTFSSKRLRWAGAVNFQRSPKSTPKKTLSTALPGLLQRCDVCKKTHDQHLLAKCDNCYHYLHLSCLDPPLTRMPKKTKQQGWQCSRCSCSNISDEDDVQVDSAGPRRLREKVRDPMKYTALFRDPGWPRRRRPPAKRPRSARAVKKDDSNECKVCHVGVTDFGDSVKCDNCASIQHLGCLVPPRTRTPRIRGYVWFCDDCQRNVISENEKQQSPGKVPQLDAVGSELQLNPLKISKLLLANGSPSKKNNISSGSSSMSPKKERKKSEQRMSITDTTKSEKMVKVKRIRKVGIERRLDLTTGRSKHKKEIGKISTNIVRRALASGRRVAKNAVVVDRALPTTKRPKKPKARRIKMAVEREFFYSSRQDPLRRPIPARIVTSFKDDEALTDDESE